MTQVIHLQTVKDIIETRTTLHLPNNLLNHAPRQSTSDGKCKWRFWTCPPASANNTDGLLVILFATIIAELTMTNQMTSGTLSRARRTLKELAEHDDLDTRIRNWIKRAIEDDEPLATDVPFYAESQWYLAGRFDTTRLADKIRRKGTIKTSAGKSIFNWQGLGFQVGVCFNAVPSRVSFLHGPLETDQNFATDNSAATHAPSTNSSSKR